VAICRAALDEHPDNASVLYNLACFETLAGHGDDAIAHLRRAIELRPDARAWAQSDEDLAALRERPDFPKS
jgi:tetratricopeptide (TPR) repeat protein